MKRTVLSLATLSLAVCAAWAQTPVQGRITEVQPAPVVPHVVVQQPAPVAPPPVMLPPQRSPIDTNRDHHISRDEARGHPFLDRNFREIDTNRDGVLSPQERRAHAHRMNNTNANAKPFDRADRNDDRYISRDEARGHPFLERHFHEIDKNRDGYLSRKEMHKFHKKNRLDTNGDHMISRWEATGHPVLEAHFNEIDTNRDGMLSPQERRAYFHQRRPGPPAHAPAYGR
ncbi:MAG: hypothetical protein RL758_1675 [Pseudomonadota bacterium]